MNTSQTKMYDAWIDGGWYECHRFFVPSILVEKVQLIEKYFKVLGRSKIPKEYRRRESHVEFAETALAILARIEAFMDLDRPLVVGSRYLDPTPWAAFGTSEDCAKNTFLDMQELCEYYDAEWQGCGAKTLFFYFRRVPWLASQISNRHNVTPHYMMGIAISLLYDIILYCGPDCEELYDIFTNDARDTAAQVKFNLVSWENMRCKVLGRHGKITHTPHNVDLGQLKRPAIPMVSCINFIEVSCGDDIAVGEQTKPISFSKPANDFVKGDDSDEVYHASAEALRKYSYLGLTGVAETSCGCMGSLKETMDEEEINRRFEDESPSLFNGYNDYM